ncbi:rho GTPase-activating protein 29 isoform X2 [Anolis carolinensis]|uniref:Rho GTPase-activating protein 29 n=1 Tax=Anolis carolinensis TaxID=28377 RepID=A0A803TD43_ANOCA
MLRQNGGGNKRGLGLTKLSTSNFFTISNSGSWGMGRSTKSSSLSSISSNSDCYDSTVVDPEYIMQLVTDVRKFADVLLYLKEAILSEAVNFKEVNEENKREVLSEIFSSIDTLAFTFGNIVSDFLMGDGDNGSTLGLPVSRQSQSFENLSVDSGGSLHEREDVQGTGHLRAEEIDSVLLRNDNGIESALSYAKAWSKYVKDIVAWVEKKLNLEMECAKSLAKIAETTKTIVGPQDYMPFQSIFINAFQNDIENSQLWQQTAAALQTNKFVQPLLGRKSELDKQRKEIKELWQREQKKMQELESTVRKAKLLYIQRQDEYEKAKSSAVRAEEEHLSSNGGIVKDTSKLEKKRKLEEEALQKAEEANEHFKTSMAEVEEKRNDLENFKSDILTQLRELVYQCDLTLKAATVNLFQMQHAQVVSQPVNCQSLCESAKLYDPGQKFSEFVKNLPKDDAPIESGSFETQSSQAGGVFTKRSNNIHASQGNLSQCSGDFPTQSLEDIASPTCQHSQKIGEKRSSSSTDVSAVRGPPPFRSWSVGNQSGGMCSDSESAGGSSESRSVDSPSASPGDFKRRLPRTPSTGTMSSADDLDEREPPSPSDCGLNDLVSEIASSPGPFRNTLLSKAAQTHKLRKLRAPSKCRECDSLVVFHGAECEECSLACHKKCLETLAIQCGHKKLHGRLHLFGVEFTQAAKNTPDGIPFIIKKCTSEIENRALNVKGIYRVNGAKSRVEKLCQAFENGKDLVELSELYAHDISNVLKLYLRQLPEPLILFRLYNEFIGLAKESQSINEELDMKQTSPRAKKRQSVCIELNRIILKIRDLLKLLPAPNYNTLQFLLGHLHRVTEHSDENKMSASNLGIIFGPTLIRPRQTDATLSLSSLVDYPYQARVVELLITYYEKIFDISVQPLLAASQLEENAACAKNTVSPENREQYQQRKTPPCVSVKESGELAQNEKKESEKDVLLEEPDGGKGTPRTSNALVAELNCELGTKQSIGKRNPPSESIPVSVLENHIQSTKELGNTMGPVLHQVSEPSPPQTEDGVKANQLMRPVRQITKVQLRSQRVKPVVRPVSLPLGQMLPPSVLNERNCRNAGLNAEKLGRSPVIEEVSEAQPLPTVNVSSRLSCYDTQTLKKTWDKQYKQYDMTARTAMIMTNVPQENRAQESVSSLSTCALPTPNSSVNAILPNKPYTVPVRAARTAAEGPSPDVNPLTAFRAPRTLQPPPGTFYKPPSNPKARTNDESSSLKLCAADIKDDIPKLAVNPGLGHGSPSQPTKQQKASSETLSPTDLKPTYQRLRPKRMQELEHREAHFV